MRIKGSELKRIIREEISRASGRQVIREGVSLKDLEIAVKTERGLMDQRMGGVIYSGIGMINEYRDVVLRLANFTPEIDRAIDDSSPAKGKVHFGFIRFAEMGSQSPMAENIISVIEGTEGVRYKARAIVAILGGFEGRIHPAMQGPNVVRDAALGGSPVDVFLLGNTGNAELLDSGEYGVKSVDMAVKQYRGSRGKTGAIGFVEDVAMIARFDIPTAVDMVNSGQTP